MGKEKFTSKDIVLCGLFAALIAAGAFIRIPLPLIPFTLQTMFVSLAGLLLGGKKGATAAFVYMALGLLGLPIFTQGGGIAYVLKPSFGYIIGFVAGAYVTGCIANKDDKPSYKRLAGSVTVGVAIIYVIGMIYVWVIMTFYMGTGISAGKLMVNCFLITLPGDMFLSVFAIILAKRLIPIVRRV